MVKLTSDCSRAPSGNASRHTSRTKLSCRTKSPWKYIAACALSAYFSGTAAKAADFRLSMEINEVHRNAVISEPRRLKHVPRTTIIVLHGIDNGMRIRSRLGLDSAVAGTGTVTVYPDAINGHWNNGLTDTPGPDDVAFLKALITKLVSAGISDPKRIYMVGATDGGMMALRFTCEAGNLLTGTATILASMPAKLAASCKLAKPAALLAISGTEDPVIPFNGGPVTLKSGKGQVTATGEVVSMASTLDIFAQKAGCAAEKKSSQFADKDKEDKTEAFLDSFSDCKIPVEMIRIQGGGHTIPGHRGPAFGPSAGTGAVNHDIESNRIIWDFFRRLPATSF